MNRNTEYFITSRKNQSVARVYKLVFKEEAKKEWDKLDPSIRSVFAKKIRERIQNPRVERPRLSGIQDCYKIKLRNAGYRLVYKVRDKEVVVAVIAVGKRNKNAVYQIACKRT
ncbi:type II toxin-antitoxin system RelE family toxin [Desulfogranum japonicum]|uniref:type II toxin-antitoxin system RelE family toxin n=1 Tax=Desulfogranum japonicum TaxID=231447 RepID=UPI0003FBD0D9|nr:type II toxin-antitoxin system RelE/ParE family toxin [Desulfogranum japonicum]